MSAREMSAAAARGRPLSPHMTVYKMSRYCLLSSILNRFTGIVLSLGELLLLYWLVSVAAGERAYDGALAVLSSLPLEIVYALIIAAFSYHLIAGIRHLIWDTGHGLSRVQSRRSAIWVFVLSIAVAIVFIAWALIPAAGAP